jgi:hypothetical protein
MEAHWCCSAQGSPLLHVLCGLALSCWNNPLCRSITCVKWGWRISSLYLTAVKLPGTCTVCFPIIWDSCPHHDTTITEAIHFLNTGGRKTFIPAPIFTYSATRFYSRKRDSSLNQILRQFRNVQPLNLLHQRTLSHLCKVVNIAPKYGLLGLMLCCRSRSRTVCELILRNPGIPAAVVDAATVRFRRWKTRIYRSCPGVVMRGLPLLWKSFVEPVCWNMFHSLEIVLWLTFRVCATWFWDSPAWRPPIAIFRVAVSNLGMAAYQISNKG